MIAPAPVLSRRSLLKAAGAAGTAAFLPLSGCASPDNRGDGVTTLRFLQNKPEVVGYFNNLIRDFESSNPDIRVVQDFNAGNWVPGLIRGNPADVVTNAYSVTVADFALKGVFADLSDLPAAASVDAKAQELINSFGQYGSGEISALPFSLAAAGVIYNKDLFAAHGVEVPTRWSELIAACRTFQAAGVTPIYGTFKDSWTLGQPFGYVAGGAADLAEFFGQMPRDAKAVEAGSPVSFRKDFRHVPEKLLELLGFTQPDAASRSYPDGNVAFAKGGAAMYMQGPWALSELITANPDINVGTFALPVTENASDTQAQVTLDMTFSITRSSPRIEAAKRFVSYLMQPEVVNAYNAQHAAFSPLAGSASAANQQIAGLQPLIAEGRYYLNVTNYFPPAITYNNYFQSLALNKNPESFLSTLDESWQRVALRNA